MNRTSILTQSASGNAVPKLNLSYQPTPDLNVYATVAGIAAGGFNLPIPLPTRWWPSIPTHNATVQVTRWCIVAAELHAGFGVEREDEEGGLPTTNYGQRGLLLHQVDRHQQVISLTCGYPHQRRQCQILRT